MGFDKNILDDFSYEQGYRRSFEYASFGRRFAAYLIDSVILSLAGFPIAFLYGDSDVNGTVFSVVVGIIYFAAMESSSGQGTVGKQLLNLRVIDERGGRISFGKAALRYFSKILSALILLIGFIMMIFDDKKQTLHDRIVGTYVIRD